MSDDLRPVEDAIAEQLRLRPERPPVTRLSRKVLAGLAGIGGLAVFGAFIWALDTSKRGGENVRQELYTTENTTTSDRLQQLPRDYTEVPKLGPPLPGDLGRPILRSRERDGLVDTPLSQPDPEEQRRRQEAEAARKSGLFASGVRPTESAHTAGGLSGSAGTGEVPAGDPNAVQNMQDRKLAFVNATVDRRTVSPDRLAAPASPFVLQAGSVIPAALITGIRSDLPGQIAAQVTDNVYDSPTGRYLLLPQGSRLIGVYDSQVAFGQKRILLVWTRLILPNGTSIVLERQQGADGQGYAGLQDRVDYHWRSLVGATLLSTVLGAGAELGQGGEESELIRALRQSGQDSVNQTGQEIVRRQLNVQPTLTIRPGFPVRVIVNRDLVLIPYGS